MYAAYNLSIVDSPGYYIFAIGLSICAILLFLSWLINFKFQKEAFAKLESVCSRKKLLRWANVITGCISTIALVLLAVFDTASYPNVHNLSAYCFVGLEAIAIFNNVRCFRRYHYKCIP